MNKLKHLVFVYGTLKKGEFNHKFLSQNNSEFISEAKTEDAMILFDLGGCPGVLNFDIFGTPVYGELWKINDECLNQLDLLEGLKQGLYKREITNVVTLSHLLNNEIVSTWIYTLPVESLSLYINCPYIKNGIWAETKIGNN